MHLSRPASFEIIKGGISPKGFIKAGIKYTARTLNDKLYENDIDRVHSKAYADTGKQLQRAKRYGYRIDAAKCYRKNHDKYLRAAKNRHNNRDKFISDF